MSAKHKPDRTVIELLYIFHVRGDVEPEIMGPFKSAKARDRKEAQLRRNDKNGVYCFKTVYGAPTLG